MNLFLLRMTTLCGRQAVVDENAFVELADQVFQVITTLCPQPHRDVAQGLLTAFPVVNLALDVRAIVGSASSETDFGQHLFPWTKWTETTFKPATGTWEPIVRYLLHKKFGSFQIPVDSFSGPLAVIGWQSQP
jgi:hypothetical protein